METNAHIMDLLGGCQFESAWKIIEQNKLSMDDLDLEPLLEDLRQKIKQASMSGEIRSSRRLDRRLKALRTFQTHGLLPKKLIRPIDLPEDYQGKILLVRLSGGMADGVICLRSGDDWHREILGNVREEIQDLGFENARVEPIGGAWVGMEQDGTIIIFGSSDDFGTLDKKMAANLIADAFPKKHIVISNS